MTQASDKQTQEPSLDAGISSRIQETAARALEKIEALGLLPLPHIYELWFRYFQGDAGVVREIDAYKGAINEDFCEQAYKKFLSASPGGDLIVKKISGQVQDSISELATMLVSARSVTSDYGVTLAGLTEEIKAADTLESVGHAVTSIVESTKKMMAKNQELEIQLVNSSHQVTELRRNLDDLTREAMTDSLTGLANRKAFEVHVQESIELFKTTETSFVLMLLDIDHFKKFNDSYGHQVGDQVLRLVARTLTDNVKGRDIASRYGGEEFAILLPDTPASAGIRVADGIRKSVESKEVVNKVTQQNMGRITLSVGVAEYCPGESISSLIARADAALYEAKKAGRNRIFEAAHPIKPVH
jgi:diguanylate cyclase